MSSDLDELNRAIAEFDWTPAPEPEFRFYYDPETRVGISLGGDHHGVYTLLTRSEYDQIGMACHFYISKSGKVKPMPLDARGRLMLELHVDGKFGTIKDCMIFADSTGPDRYKIRDFYDD